MKASLSRGFIGGVVDVVVAESRICVLAGVEPRGRGIDHRGDCRLADVAPHERDCVPARVVPSPTTGFGMTCPPASRADVGMNGCPHRVVTGPGVSRPLERGCGSTDTELHRRSHLYPVVNARSHVHNARGP